MTKHALYSTGAKLWRSLACSKSELRLDLTLACGQSFRWRETSEGHWTGVMGGRVWTLTQTEDTLWYYVYTKQEMHSDGGGEKEAELLRDYFQLHVRLQDLYREWGAADCHFSQIAEIFSGVRMLRQDPTECLFSFICTSNNHISRIQGMVERLCQSLGSHLCQLDQTAYHDFPSLSALADSSVEARLRDLGFGYRARFLQQSARQILDNHGLKWLDGLRKVPYLEARDALRTLPGVGTKVADCVCLMSLDKSEAVPVDTHVWQIAKRDYKYPASNGQKSLTEKVHREIGDYFRKLWGPYAGWTQSVLFCADLKKFQDLKTPKKEERVEEKSKKTNTKRGHGGNKDKTLPCCKKTKIHVKKEEVL